MGQLRLLEWDSELLGMPVGRIDLDRSAMTSGGEVRERAAAAGMRLCYLFAAGEESAKIAGATGARLVDRRLLLRRVLTGENRSCADAPVESVGVPRDLPELRALALQSAQFSRFKVDPSMPAQAWQRLYTLWIENSLAGTMADATLVERDHGRVVGMLTVKKESEEGVIGLFAVSEAARGTGRGRRLLERASSWFVAQGCTTASVVTQGDNLPARRIYERTGYSVAEVTNVYHLWLR